MGYHVLVQVVPDVSKDCSAIIFRAIAFIFGLLEPAGMGRDSPVGIATCYELDGPGIESRWGRFSAPVLTGPGAHQASCAVGTGSFP